MHFIFSALGSAGDVHPFVGIGSRLRQRGHRVTIMTNPRFESLVGRLGLDFEPIGTVEEFDAVVRNPDLWHPTRGFSTVAEFGITATMRRTYELIAGYYVPGQTVVGGHSLDFGARIARDKLGVPLATLHLAPAVLRSETLPPVLTPWLTGQWSPRWWLRLGYWLADFLVADRLLAGPVNAFRAELGLPPVKRFLHRWWHSPDRVIGLFPSWFAPPQPDWPPQTILTGFPRWDESVFSELAGDVVAYLEAGDPPVIFTPGSAMAHGQPFFRAAVGACARTGRRAIFLTGYADQLPGRLPAGVIHFDYVPFSQLFSRSAAIVHHGGIGTVSQGLAAGIPQLLMPMAHDQHDNAVRLRRLGVGSSLRPRAFRAATVARTLDRLLASPTVRARCRGVASRLEGVDAMGSACDVLERLGARGSTYDETTRAR